MKAEWEQRGEKDVTGMWRDNGGTHGRWRQEEALSRVKGPEADRPGKWG